MIWIYNAVDETNNLLVAGRIVATVTTIEDRHHYWKVPGEPMHTASNLDDAKRHAEAWVRKAGMVPPNSAFAHERCEECDRAECTVGRGLQICDGTANIPRRDCPVCKAEADAELACRENRRDWRAEALALRAAAMPADVLHVPMRTDLYDRTWVQYGATAQIAMLAEEAAELAVDALHVCRGRKTGEDLAEELADVLIMIGQVAHRFDLRAEIDAQVCKKLDRLQRRLTESETRAAKAKAP